MRKSICIIVVLCLWTGCKKNTDTQAIEQAHELEFNYQKMPKKLEIGPEATSIVEGWPEFKTLASSFDVLYKATNNEELILAIDDLIEKEKLLAQAVYPSEFDAFQIKGRQRVLRTYLYKVKASIQNNQEVTGPAIEMLEAYNSLRKQLNIMVKSQLDEKLILDEG